MSKSRILPILVISVTLACGLLIFIYKPWSKSVAIMPANQVSFYLEKDSISLADSDVSLPISILQYSKPSNLVNLEISYNQQMLEIVEIDISNKFGGLVINRGIDNESGKANITIAIPNPKPQSLRSEFVVLTIKPKQKGEALIQITENTVAYENSLDNNQQEVVTDSLKFEIN